MTGGGVPRRTEGCNLPSRHPALLLRLPLLAPALAPAAHPLTALDGPEITFTVFQFSPGQNPASPAPFPTGTSCLTITRLLPSQPERLGHQRGRHVKVLCAQRVN
jgi:hypothetical protein